uniref:Uncharacterized protein n=1 Tax=Anopheles culicifacies TaxID=139723 RepID=A0A182M4W6_9DIPT
MQRNDDNDTSRQFPSSLEVTRSIHDRTAFQGCVTAVDDSKADLIHFPSGSGHDVKSTPESIGATGVDWSTPESIGAIGVVRSTPEWMESDSEFYRSRSGFVNPLLSSHH